MVRVGDFRVRTLIQFPAKPNKEGLEWKVLHSIDNTYIIVLHIPTGNRIRIDRPET